jgi:hypothetical protein
MPFVLPHLQQIEHGVASPKHIAALRITSRLSTSHLETIDDADLATVLT